MDGYSFCFGFEQDLIIWMQQILGDAAKYIGTFFSCFGETLFLIVLLGFIYWCWDKEAGKKIGVNIVLALTLNTMSKNIVLRRRPYMDNPDIKCLRAPSDASADPYDIAVQGYSFPSGHSTNSAVVYGTFQFIFSNKIFRYLAILLPLLTGLSRLMLGVHYPTDVIGGWLLGYGVVFLLALMRKLIKKRWIIHLIVFAVSVPGFFFCRTEDYFTSMGVMAGLFAAIPFEEKFVFFENTRKPLYCLLRLIGGIGGFALLNWVLKLPFDPEFLSDGTILSCMVRFARYAVTVFVLIGLYPMSFRTVEGYIELKRK